MSFDVPVVRHAFERRGAVANYQVEVVQQAVMAAMPTERSMGIFHCFEKLGLLAEGAQQADHALASPPSHSTMEASGICSLLLLFTTMCEKLDEHIYYIQHMMKRKDAKIVDAVTQGRCSWSGSTRTACTILRRPMWLPSAACLKSTGELPAASSQM